MNEEFLSFFSHNSINKNAKFLLGVSGGVDSVLLSFLFHKNQLNFGIAHCNFRLRGVESDEDEKFVLELAENYGVRVFTRPFETESYSKSKKISIQMAARELRYNWFSSLIEEEGYDFMVTAHHHNDVLETVIFNLIKGTGIAGLRGIMPVTDKMIRPMLKIEKKNIIGYARSVKLKWREDSSNLSNKYHRNLIRNKIIPLMEQINPGLSSTMEATIEKLKAVDEIYREKVDYWTKNLLHKAGKDLRISKEDLKSNANAAPVLYELIRTFGFNFDQAKQILEGIDGSSGKQFQSQKYQLVIDREDIYISKLAKSSGVLIKIEEDTGYVDFSAGFFKIKRYTGDLQSLISDPNIAQMDKSKLKFPLTLRHWENGDFFIPLGMKGKKKVSDFMIDQKIPLNLKSRVMVLCSGKDIAWIAGQRLDQRYRLTDKTKEIYQIHFKSND